MKDYEMKTLGVVLSDVTRLVQNLSSGTRFRAEQYVYFLKDCRNLGILFKACTAVGLPAVAKAGRQSN